MHKILVGGINSLLNHIRKVILRRKTTINRTNCLMSDKRQISEALFRMYLGPVQYDDSTYIIPFVRFSMT